MTQAEYLTTQLSPLRWPLYAFALEGGGGARAAEFLEIANPPDSAKAWQAYADEVSSLEEAGGSLRDVREILRLDPFCFFTVKLALAAQLFPAYRAVLDSFGGLTLDLALRVFSASREEASSLYALWRSQKRAAGLLFTDTGGGAPLRLRPVVFDFLLGLAAPPEHCAVLTPDAPLYPTLVNSDIPRLIAAQLSVRPSGNVFCLCGAKGSGRKFWVTRFLQEHGGICARLEPGEAFGKPEAMADLAAFLTLTGAFLYVGDYEKPLEALLRALRPANVFLACGEEASLPAAEGYSVIPLKTPVLGFEQRLAIWGTCMPEADAEDLRVMSARYRFTTGQILDACREARESAVRAGGAAVTAVCLHTACKGRLTHGMDKLAQRARSEYVWDDLILPKEQKELLFHIRDRVLYGETVRGAWGLDRRACGTSGVRALFSGPPGTGKTMAAQILARELGMEMYTVNLAMLVSKYIGETEKNLESVFTEAAKSAGVLFFDEADALFGKRGEQRDSHDKYANMQTAFLLQRFESFDGVALLATNLTSNLDPAFLRRIHLRVEFPAPDAETRVLLWKSFMENSRAPLDGGIDARFLAETFELSGSAIRNTVLTAAYIAAARSGVIGMGEILRAVGMEYAKLDKVLTARELGEWGEQLIP
ncbi:MAG: ATP-binding protein [Oscillospiraceae bacterium]|jgi:hypothetical protein|nr:ATP-binding protein [Oscillospiraceae bacterium]